MGRRRDALEGPALALSHALTEAGHPGLAAFLSEAIPDTGAITSDQYRTLLAARLRTVAERPDVPDRLRGEASRLLAVNTALPSAIGRTGRVFIAWMDEPSSADAPQEPPEPGGYTALWQAGDGDDDLYEEGPPFPTLEEALAWAQRRADSVLVRPAWDPGVYYWSGTGPAPAGIPPL